MTSEPVFRKCRKWGRKLYIFSDLCKFDNLVFIYIAIFIRADVQDKINIVGETLIHFFQSPVSRVGELLGIGRTPEPGVGQFLAKNAWTFKTSSDVLSCSIFKEYDIGSVNTACTADVH